MTATEPQTFLITASTGIGAATARLLASFGHRIFIASLGAEHGEALVREIQSEGGTCQYLAVDLCEAHAASEVIQKCLDAYGRIDGLYNVAGISGRRYGDGPLHECTDEGWEKVMETNVSTLFRMSREAVKVMLAQERNAVGSRGCILNMASVLGLHPEPGHFKTIAYASGKGAIISMSRTAAALYAAEGVRINVIAPGLVKTPMSARASEDESILHFMKNKQPLTQGVMDTKPIAETSAFLLQDSSAGMTGEVVKVDGGWCLN